MRVHTYTHTHIYIYIYIYIFMPYIILVLFLWRKPDNTTCFLPEPRLAPVSMPQGRTEALCP